MILQKINNRCGFTLIEVMIVIAILAIGCAIMIPMIAGIIESTEVSTEVEIVDQDSEEASQPSVEKKQVEEKEESNKL